MILTTKSENNILYILKNYNENIILNKKTINKKSLIRKIYNLLKETNNISSKIKYKIIETDDLELINTDNKNLSYGKFFPKDIYNYIQEYMNYKINFTLKIKNLKINLSFYFLASNNDEKNIIKKYIINSLKYVKNWLYICDLYSSNLKINELNIKIFLTPFIKKNDNNENKSLSSYHVNSGYTQHSLTNSNYKDIVIFRKEEWFKVFIHECIHAYNLDFNMLNYNNEINILQKEFKNINSEFLFNESYCEFWAQIINLSYYSLNQTTNYKDFLINFEINITLEKIFSIMQMNKILNYNNIDYNLLNNNNNLNFYYKEDTNIFCYYILKTVLLYNYEEVFDWCNKNNINFLDFKKTSNNINSFLKLILKLKNNKKFKNFVLKNKNNINNNNLELCLLELSF